MAKESMDALSSSSASAADFIVSCNRVYTSVCLCRATSIFDKDKLFTREKLLFFVEDLRTREEAMEPGGFISFLQVLPTSCSQLFLQDVNLVSSEELCALCNGFTSSSLHRLSMNHVEQTYSSTEPTCVKAVICEALKEVSSLRMLTITLEESSFINGALDGALVSLFSHRSAGMIKWLGLEIASCRGSIDLPRFFTSLAENTASVTHLRMVDPLWTISSFKEWAFMLSTNTSIKHLGLRHFDISEEQLHSLFTSLENNLTLTSLGLTRCRGKGLSATLLLDCLQANGIVDKLDLDETPLDGNALIEAQLKSNSGNSKRLKLLHEQNASKIKVQPRGARLFFCGFPFSGKTTLSKTLVGWSKTTPSRSRSINCFSCVRSSVQDRTRGIEVTFLEKDGLKVSLWDLAGQPEYHSLHDHMFPNLSDRATPALFLFVWNPIKLNPKNDYKVIMNEDGRAMKKSVEIFKTEFKYWLKFIASKTQKSVKYKPTVFVVLTRGDLTNYRTKALVKDTTINLKGEFEDYIHFPTDGVCEVDARECGNVEHLALQIFSHVKIVLGSAPRVYEACEFARQELSRLVQRKQIAPLVAKKNFSVLCHKLLGIISEEMQQAIAETLNNSGDLIYLNSVDCVVMDTHWFCHEIMGGLLDKCMKNECTDGTIDQGFFPIQFLEGLLEFEVNRTTRGNSKHRRSGFSRKLEFSKVRGEDLVKLLVGVQLACSLDNNQETPSVFIPASLYKCGGGDIDPCKHFKPHNKQTYVGRRLRCKDSNCTFFTPAIFYRLQVMFKNIFSARQVEVRLEENVIAFACDAVEVFIEFCSQGSEDHFMDILIHSHENLENTLEWVREEVTDRMVKACADPKGIQGVELVHAAILPACVQRCDLLKDRSPHAIPIEIFKDIVIMYLDKKGFQLTVKDGFRNVPHTWQSTKDVIPVVDILGEVETLKIVESYSHSLSVAAEESLNTNVEEKKFTMRKSLEKQMSFSSAMLGEEATLCDLGQYVGSKIDNMQKYLGSKINNTQKDLGSKIDDLGSKIDNLHKGLHNEFENLRNDVLPKLVEKMNQLLNEMKLGELPRMYVVTRNDGHMGRKLLAAIVPGLQNVHLELLCERRGQPHFVDGQHGLTLTALEDGVVKRGLPYIYAFFQTANVLVKVAAHVAVGLGDSVPDFTQVLASIVDTPEFLSSLPSWSGPVAHPSASTASISRTNLHESQQWLREVLSNYKCNTDAQIRKVFGLSRVQYCNGEIAWVCEKHKHEGDSLPK